VFLKNKRKEIAVIQNNTERLLFSLPLRVFEAMHSRDARFSGHEHDYDAAGQGACSRNGASTLEGGEAQFPLDSGGGSFRDLFTRAFDFRLSDILRLRTFLYLLPVTAILLFQTYNIIAIKKLALENEMLRERIAMSSSVITAQELKVNELLGIHNIALHAERLGLHASSVPAIEIVP